MAGGFTDWETLKNLLRNLNENIENFNGKSSRYSKILISLTIVLAVLAVIQIYLLIIR